jgi:hypothetical protein
MNLSKYDFVGDGASNEHVARYHELHDRLVALSSAPTKDMVAIDAVIVELDELQAAVKRSRKGDLDTQRF